MSSLRFGVDVGGTFTDAVLIDGAQVWTAKSPTTANFVDGVIAACELAAERAGSSLAEVLPRVGRFGLGTTAVTNAIASRRGVRTGLLITKGFEETLHLSRGHLVETDLRMDHGFEIMALRDIAGIDERIDRHGVVIKPLDMAGAVAAARQLVEDGVEALAVSFLWSIVNPSHEIGVAQAIREALPGIPVTAASELLPVAREYERTTLAVLNSYVSSACAGVEVLAERLADLGLTAPLLLVHSGGGTISVPEAKARPVWLAESGPAAGVMAAASTAAQAGASHAISCDMGGTSFDVSDVANETPSRVTRGELMGIWTALPRVDVESIGAGGGSIGWIDARNMLRVGPQSAGSRPGPVCYGHGGIEPTVTDALVVLGYIDAANFLGGDMQLDREGAVAACKALGEPLGLDAEAAAWGIREIALAEMTKAVRTRLALRGLDPRNHALVSFGGCASLF
ncbi:MAG: hydantoinase/oxoprolinase family protein, partial [Novosphingobium sp.]|nr:hydantoinase/oxoprolinase family protein [Novosphingobium sp.]